MPGSTKISTSPRKYEQLAQMEKSKVSEINDKDDGEHVSVVIKVLNFAKIEVVKSGLFKRDVKVGESSGNIRLTFMAE